MKEKIKKIGLLFFYLIFYLFIWIIFIFSLFGILVLRTEKKTFLLLFLLLFFLSGYFLRNHFKFLFFIIRKFLFLLLKVFLKKPLQISIGILVVGIILGYLIFWIDIEKYVDRKCRSDKDCTFVNLGYCWGCGPGAPVNKKSAKIINLINTFRHNRHNRSLCPLIIIKCPSHLFKSVCENSECKKKEY